jgi:hypothetical protein
MNAFVHRFLLLLTIPLTPSYYRSRARNTKPLRAFHAQSRRHFELPPR